MRKLIIIFLKSLIAWKYKIITFEFDNGIKTVGVISGKDKSKQILEILDNTGGWAKTSDEEWEVTK